MGDGVEGSRMPFTLDHGAPGPDPGDLEDVDDRRTRTARRSVSFGHPPGSDRDDHRGSIGALLLPSPARRGCDPGRGRGWPPRGGHRPPRACVACVLDDCPGRNASLGMRVPPVICTCARSSRYGATVVECLPCPFPKSKSDVDADVDVDVKCGGGQPRSRTEEVHPRARRRLRHVRSAAPQHEAS